MEQELERHPEKAYEFFTTTMRAGDTDIAYWIFDNYEVKNPLEAEWIKIHEDALKSLE